MSTDTPTVANRRKKLALWIQSRCDGSQAKFIEETGINQGELSALLRDKSFGEKKARNLEKQAGMPDLYLDIPIENEEDSEPPSQSVVFGGFGKKQKGLHRIDQFDDVRGAMGVGVILQDQPGQITSWEVTAEWLAKNIPANTGSRNLKIITGFGNSMQGMFNPGDPLVIDVGVKECNHDGVFFFRVGDEGFVKTLQRIPGEGIRVISKNPDYESWTIKEGMDFEVLGKVLKVWKSDIF